MLSRAGKYTDEKYTVLKNKEEILSGFRRKFVVKSNMLIPQKDPDEILLEKVRIMHNK